MSTKDLISKVLSSGYFESRDEKGFSSLVDGIVSKMPLKELLSLKNKMIDQTFKNIMQDEDMVNCIEEFFKYDLNVDETSRNSFMHRNTLVYRIDRIFALTGLNLRKFEDALSFKILMQVYRLTS